MRKTSATLILFLLATAGCGPKKNGDEVRELIRQGATIIDVRTPQEFAAGNYPGARNIPVSEISARLNEIPRDKPVILHCQSGRRSSVAKEILESAGYTRVINAGGLADMPR